VAIPVNSTSAQTPGQLGSQLPSPIAASSLQLSREYVAGGSLWWYPAVGRALPWAFDDLTGDLGDDIYEKMMVDPQITACMSIFKAGVLEDGLSLRPAIDDNADPEYDLALSITEEAEAMLDNLQTALDDVLWDMLNSIAFGSKVAELVFELQPGVTEKRRMLHLVALKPKPRRSTSFVVDAYTNVLGMLARLPGQQTPYLDQAAFDPKNPPADFLPRSKFAISTFRSTNGDPRGSSLLRAAYDPWWRKRQILPEYLKFLAQFAGPSIVGFTSPDAQTQPATDDYGNLQVDASGNPILPTTPEQAMLVGLTNLRNGSVAVFPGGATIHPLINTGDGVGFLKALAECNISITKALLTQELATEEGEHMSRAAASVHQDVLNTLIRQAKRGTLRMITKDILKPWVIYNWGDKATHLIPVPSLGEAQQQDLGPMITALAAAGYQVSPSMMPEIDSILNLPVRDLDADMAFMPDDGLMYTPQTPQQAPADPNAPTPVTAPTGATVPERPVSGPSGPSPTKTVPTPLPPGRIAVRGHTRGVRPRPATVGMSAEQIVPRGEPLPQTTASAKYTAADLRALARAWDESLPEYKGALKATVQQTKHG